MATGYHSGDQPIRRTADGRRRENAESRLDGQAARTILADRARAWGRAGVHRGPARHRQGGQPRRRRRLRGAVPPGLRQHRDRAEGGRRRLEERGAVHDLPGAFAGRAEAARVPPARVRQLFPGRCVSAEHAAHHRPAGERVVSHRSADGGRALIAKLLLAALALASAQALAQAYPQKPVRVIVPAPAGGPTDVPGRLIADGLSNLVGQRFVVENRVGAGGLVAGEYVSRAAPDGYTLLYANTSVLAVNPALQGANMPYDPAKAFAPVGFVSNSPQLLVANPKVPYRTVQELVAWARKNPGKLNFATAGVGTLPHLTFELFRMETGIDALNVPYSGGGPAVIAGQADVLFDLFSPRVKSGEVRAIAITGPERNADLPDVPTIAESGYPAVASTSGTGIVAPAGISKDIVAMLNAKLNELIARPETQAKMKSFGLVPKAGTPEEFGAWAAQERERWTRVVKVSGAKAE